MQRGRWTYLAGPILCFWGGFWLSGLRWQEVLRGMDLHLGLRKLLILNLEGFFWNNFLPSTIGGDGYRFLKLSRLYPAHRAGVLASVFLDRLYGYLTLLGIHLLLLPFLTPFLQGQRVLMGIEGGMVAGVVVFVFFWRARHTWIERLGAWIEGVAWIRDKVSRVLEMMAGCSRVTMARSTIYSGGFVVLNGLALWFYLRALDVSLPFLPVLYASTLAAVLGALPLSLNGLGLMELALVLALSPWGVLREEVLLAAFLLRGVNMVMAVPGGVLYLLDSWLAA